MFVLGWSPPPRRGTVLLTVLLLAAADVNTLNAPEPVSSPVQAVSVNP